MVALLASALAAGLLLASLGGPIPLAVAVAVLQALLLYGWSRAWDIPAARPSALVALVFGWLATGFTVNRSEEALDIAVLGPVLGAIGIGFVVMVIIQLARRDGRARLTASLTLGVAGLVLSASAAIWLGLGRDETTEALLVLALAGTLVGALAYAIPGPRWLIGILAALLAGGTGLLMETALPMISDTGLSFEAVSLTAGLCGLTAAAAMWVVGLIRDDPQSAQGSDEGRSLPYTLVGAALPVVLAAPVAFAASWAVVEEVFSRG